MFKTELHCHSSEVSACATVGSEDIVEKYLNAGYSSVVLTNHFSQHTYKNSKMDISYMSWDEKVDYFLDGYYKLKDKAQGRLNIILGMELRFNTETNDYLVYGVTEQFLREHPDMLEKNTRKFSSVIRENGMLLIQAHPFRNNMKIIAPNLLDGIEVFNGHTGQESRNDIANMWADKFGFIKTSGTDHHHDHHVPSGGILTSKPITSSEELITVLRNGNYELIRTPVVPY